MTSLLLPTALVVLMTASASSYCPKKCNCFATSVSCFGTTDFDKSYFTSSTEKITFWGSNISIIPGRIFSNVRQELFQSSQRSIHFHSCNIGTIEGEAFTNLQNVESILFENVNISRIKEGSFKNLKNIKSFAFLGSNIGIIDQNAFVTFVNISDFRISNTNIETIFDNAFCDFQNISKFEISLAEIKSMENNSFSSFQGISWFELSWNKFKSRGCSSLIQVALASNYSKFAQNYFPCDCNFYCIMETLHLSSLEDVNYCTYAGGTFVYQSQINGGMNSVLGECSPCQSVTNASLSLAVIISTMGSVLNGTAPKEGTTTGRLHMDYTTTSSEPRSDTLLAIVNMSTTTLVSSKLKNMTKTTTTMATTITKHSETSENQSSNAICSGTCSTNNWTSIYNTESTTNFINAAKDVSEETRAVTDINNSTLKISSDLTLTGFPTSPATTFLPSLATILLSRLSTTFLSTRLPTALPPTSSPTSSSTTSSPISSSTTSSSTTLPTKPYALSGEYNVKFTTGYGNEFGLYNGTLSKISLSSSHTAPALSSTTFRATKTKFVVATTAAATTNASVHSSSSKSKMVTTYRSSSVESSTKLFSAIQTVKFFGSIAATRPAPETSLGKTSSPFSSSSTGTVYPKISFLLWTDATRVSKKTTEVPSEPVRGRTSRICVNGSLPVAISCILAFTLRFHLN